MSTSQSGTISSSAGWSSLYAEPTARPIVHSGDTRPYGATLLSSAGQAARHATAEPTKAPVTHSLLTRCTCEFGGTFMLVFVVACCPDGPWFPTAVAGVYVALVYTLAQISGAHLNPAISLAACAAWRMPFKFFISYIISQVLGGLLGGLFFRLVFGVPPISLFVEPIGPYHFGEATLIEILYTTMLAFVALNVTCSVNNNRNQFYGIAIGFVIIAGGYISLKISGALFNPALSLGLTAGTLHLQTFISGAWYALIELGGGLIAAWLFRICRHNEYRPAQESDYEVEDGGHRTRDGMLPATLPSKAFAEFIGTFWLVLTAGLNTVLQTGATAWSLAGVLISLIYALGSVSGGHFNPAVTFAIVLSGRDKCSRKEGLWFVLAQAVSAIPAGLIAAAAIRDPATTHSAISTVAAANSTNSSIVVDGLFCLHSRYNWLDIGLVEVIFTFLLAYVVLVVATSEMHSNSAGRSWPNLYFALAIGFTVAAAGYAASNISGGYLNPAIALGFAVEGQPNLYSSVSISEWPGFGLCILRFFATLVNGIGYYLQCFAYWFPEFLGAGLAVAVFKITHSVEYPGKGAFY